MDSDRFIRIGGHLKNAVLDYDERYFHVLLKESVLTALMNRNGYQAVKNVLSRCVTCVDIVQVLARK